jgi:hypothetical protein
MSASASWSKKSNRTVYDPDPSAGFTGEAVNPDDPTGVDTDEG